MTKTTKKRLALTWDQCSVSCTPNGGWHFVMPIPERANVMSRMWGGKMRTNEKHRADKQQAPFRFRHVTPLGGYVRVVILWVRERRSGDTDGRVKATLDLLRGIAYPDDASVADVRILRVDDLAETPRVEVIVTPCEAPTMQTWRAA